jgi:hypothetical protein
MNNLKRYFGIVFCCFSAFLFLNSCEELNLDNDSRIVAGLKEALKVGTNEAVSVLSQNGGYLTDETVKILLPEEAQVTFGAVKAIASNQAVQAAVTALGVNLSPDLESILITAFNRAAEQAVPDAANVFIGAITSMSIADGKDILFSSNDEAATDYLRINTYSGLQAAFKPVITSSLESVQVDDYTAVTAWDFFATQNNRLAEVISSSSVQTAILGAQLLGGLSSSQVEMINSVQLVNTNLADYVTGKALDGVFVKIGLQEYKIRTDANARTSQLLKDVFGKLDNR